MNNIGFEYYYLSGKNISLKDYGLGYIKQPTLNDFIESNTDINNYIYTITLNMK